MYADIFGLDFLTPLTDTDTQFKLEPHAQLDLGRYSEMVSNLTDIINGPDLLGNVYTPRGNIQVHSPYLEVSAFNPRSRQSNNSSNSRKSENNKNDTPSALTTPRVRSKRTTLPQSFRRATWRPWKRKPKETQIVEKLLIPLPIPHPVHIAISIYNRDSDAPIPLDSSMCGDILKSIEDCNGDMAAINVVARYRGGGGAGGVGSGIATGESSMDSLESQTSGDTRDSIDMIGSTDIGGTETLPCTNREPPTSTVQVASSIVVATPSSQDTVSSAQGCAQGSGNTSYHWTLSSWGGSRRNRNNNSNTETVRVDLASPEDISLDTDSTRVVFSAYGTTV